MVPVLPTSGPSLDEAAFEVALAAANVGIRVLAAVKDLLLSACKSSSRTWRGRLWTLKAARAVSRNNFAVLAKPRSLRNRYREGTAQGVTGQRSGAVDGEQEVGVLAWII